MWILFFLLFNIQVDAKKKTHRAQPVPVRSEIRCGIDVGSGETKYAIGEVVLQGRTVKEVKKIILNRKEIIKIKDQVKDEVLADSAVEELRKSLEAFKKECETNKGVKITGVATSGFRAAKKNGVQILKKINDDLAIPITILTGEEEGLVGLQAIQDLVDPKTKNWILWDVGGGSQQLGVKIEDRQIVDSINMGANVFRDELVKFLGRKSKEDLYPVSAEEIERIIPWAKGFAKLYGQELKVQVQKVGSPVYAVGGPMSGLSESLGVNDIFTLELMQQKITEFTGLSLDEIKKKVPQNNYPYNILSNLLLIRSLAQEFGFKKMFYLSEVHLGTGLLKSDLYWK